jgi:hypothetical protein
MSAFETRLHALNPEQDACFQAMRADLRALTEIGDVLAADTLFAAFAYGTSADWRRAVRAVRRVLNIASANVAARARARLAQFVTENADLLRGDDR